MQTITTVELKELLYNVRGAKMVSFIARTEPDMVGGKSCPLAGLTKVAHVNGVINWNYTNAVNNQRMREEQPLNENGEVEEFVAEPRKWGRRLHELLAEGRRPTRMLPFVQHIKGTKWDGERITAEEFAEVPVENLYLEYKHENSLQHRYELQGKEVSHEDAERHIRPKSASSRQGTEKEIILRDYKLTNIEQMFIDGETYVIKN